MIGRDEHTFDSRALVVLQTSSSSEWVGACLLIERFRGQIDTIRPYHGARLSVDLDPGEVSGIVERFQDPCPVPREIHVADGPVAE